MKDLFILVADKDSEQCMLALLDRWPALEQFGIGPFSFDVRVHPKKDGGCRTKSLDLMRAVQRSYRYGLVIFDHEGCGAESTAASIVADDVRDELERNGWAGRVEVMLHEPELENWIWTDHDHMAQTAGWPGKTELYEHIAAKGWTLTANGKPQRPKESFEDALRTKRVQWSSSLFGEIAEHAPLRRCQDATFKAVMHQLAKWFPLEQHP